MSTYSNRLQSALQNLSQRVVRFFHPRSSCTRKHLSVDVQRITLNASFMTISGGRTKQLDIFCRVTGFTSDFLSFIVVELIRFFHGALQLFLHSTSIGQTQMDRQKWCFNIAVSLIIKCIYSVKYLKREVCGDCKPPPRQLLIHQNSLNCLFPVMVRRRLAARKQIGVSICGGSCKSFPRI